MAQLDPLTGETVAPLPDPGVRENGDGTDIGGLPALDRRRGPRRADESDPEIPAERRQGDRRKRTPGLPALLGAILADDEDADPEA